MQRIFYTSISMKYLPNAIILAESVKSIYPDSKFFLLLSDWVEELSTHFDVFDEIIFSHQLSIANFKTVAFQYSVIELCTAVKGPALEYIFSEYAPDIVIYLDPDTILFSPLKELDDTASSIFLTPHITDAEDSLEAIESHEIAALKHGTFNLGFYAVRNNAAGREFSRWFSDRLLRFSFIDFNRGLFTDQKWANIAPYIFEGVHVIVNRSYNVATWNLKRRKISFSNNLWCINNSPLVFYHFSGFGNNFYWADFEINRFATNDLPLRQLWDLYKVKYKNLVDSISKSAADRQNAWDFFSGSDISITKENRNDFNKLNLRGDVTLLDPFDRGAFLYHFPVL